MACEQRCPTCLDFVGVDSDGNFLGTCSYIECPYEASFEEEGFEELDFNEE